MTCTKNIVGKYQCRFRKGKATIDQIQSMRRIKAKPSGYEISTFCLFVDFKAACDTTRRGRLLEALKEFKIPEKLNRPVTLTLKHVRYAVVIQNNLPEQCETSVGLRQGDAVSCIVFNLAFEKVIRCSEIDIMKVGARRSAVG